jgi:protoporphyrinogen/coproporphyrinogen III oxidase
MKNNEKRILVLGGGITGLSTAYYLQKQIKEQHLPYSVTVLEQSDRWGGKINTERVDGFVIEKGPDSFLGRKQAIIDLSLELGLEGEFVGTNPAARKNFIFHNHKLHLMPPGLILGVPTQMGPFVQTGLISPLGKLRAALDLLIPAKTDQSDESLGAFLQRRLGRAVAENIAEPLLSGIYAGDTSVLSLKATFPQFMEIEQKYGSLIKGMMLSRKPGGGAQTGRAPAPSSKVPDIAKKSMFISYRQGLSTLVERLVEVLTESGVRLQLNLAVQKIVKEGDGHIVQTASGERLAADVLVLAAPAYVTRQLLQDVEGVEKLIDIPYVSVANIALAFDKKTVNHPLDASGFVIPRNEGRKITACTWTSSKWLHTSPQDKVLLRCYVGHSRNQSMVDHSDEELLGDVLGEVKDMMGITAKPIFYRVTRWRKSMPQYLVGHLDRLKQVRSLLEKERPGIYLAGAGYQGVGVPDCIQQGKDAAETAIAFIGKASERVAMV